MGHKKKNKKTSKKTYSRKALKKAIISIFSEAPQKTLNYKQIAKKINVTDTSVKAQISSILDEFTLHEILAQENRGKYKLIYQPGYILGTLDLSAKGRAVATVDETDEEVVILHNNLNHALHGDRVKVGLFAKRKKRALEGEVLEVIERAKTSFVGILEVTKNFAFLTTETKTMPYDIFVPLGKLKGAKNGQKAIARIIEWPRHVKNPIGEITEVLGNAGEHEVEIHSILAEYGLPLVFPENITKAAQKIPEEINKDEIAKRRDFRKTTTFTIDPADAKDFDDALSLKKLENGNWEVGVHIADVTHYVKQDTVLDKEALERATSIYLVDRVVPMLPERLSNLICSLRPNEEKLTFSVVFELDKQAQIQDTWIGKTIIKSDRRFSYEEAQDIIEGQTGDFANEILTLNALAKKIRKERFKEGSIGFDRVEPKFEIDEEGKPLRVFFKESKESNKLIEEFMLLANKAATEFVGKQGKTFVYRIHDEPDPEKLKTFVKFIHQFGYHINISSGREIAKSMNKLFEDIDGKQEQNVIEQLAIRTMAKAVYTTENIGHYGLGFEYYSHFTSPIRRYPDVMVHRLLEHYLAGGKSLQQRNFEKKCRHSSDMEQKAVMAERASIKFKQVEFMQDKLGEVYKGIISGVTEWGIYVELDDTKIEGMVPLKDLEDDYYIYDEKNYCIIGRYHKKKYQLGDEITIQVVKTNLIKKQLDFVVYSE